MWLCVSGLPGLAGPLSLVDLAGLHSALAQDAAALAPFEAVTLGAAFGPAAGEWRHARGGDAPGPAVLVVGACGSSLDVARELVSRDMLPAFASVLAVSQTKGRGQLRRHWSSPPGNIYAAWAWPDDRPDLDTMAPVLAGFLLAEGLAAQGVPVKLKWPNDLIVDEGKVGGVLLEEREGRVLVGVGLNLASAPEASRLRPNHALPAAALGGLGVRTGPITLWAELVKFVQSCYDNSVTASDSRELAVRMERRLAWLGREIEVYEGDNEGFRARVAGLAEDGGLRLRRLAAAEGQDFVLHSGSIALL